MLSKAVARKKSKTFITDGATNFHEAYEEEFYTNRLETGPEHIRDIRFDGVIHDNKLEPMNGKLRDWERVVRQNPRKV